MHTLPTTLYCTTQIKELEQRISQQDGISLFELMNRAGAAVFQCIQKKWATAQSIAVFCGAGNNAGDGYVVATLALKWGLTVRVYSLIDPKELQGDALAACRQYVMAQGVIVPFRANQLIDAEVIVDALLGTGLNRTINEQYALAIHAINQSELPVIAIDIPSGLHADTGQVLGHAVKAACTVTFIGLKQGLFTGAATQQCGDIIYAPLTNNDAVFSQVAVSAKRIVHSALPKRNRCANKGHYGHVLIIGGDVGYSGAVRLAGEAALRVGAGLVSIATHPEHAHLLNAGRYELMCHGVSNAQQLKVLLDKASVIVVGPGLGQSQWSRLLFGEVIKMQKPLIIDADALNLLAMITIENFMTAVRFQKSFQISFDSSPDPDEKPAPPTKSKLAWILTPHPGEAARLLNCSTAVIEEDRFAAVNALHTKYHHSIAVLKGAGTLIASEHGIAVSNTGNPGMASGGMGDVLAGVIGGLIAQGLPLVQAAQQGVYGHGLAADWAATQAGERGLLASDLMPYLRQWVNS